MSLLRDVVAVLEANGIDHTLIGAAAMAVHGVSRATADVDFFTVDDKVLQAKLWNELEGRGASLRLLKGDFEDPLAGSVRLTLARNRTVDVVVGRYAWQKTISTGHGVRFTSWRSASRKGAHFSLVGYG